MAQQQGKDKNDLRTMSRLDAHWHYSVAASVEQAKEILKQVYKNPKLRRYAQILIGESGIGKNHLQDQVAEEMGIKLLWFPCKGIAPEDLRGLPLPVHALKTSKTYKKDMEGLVDVVTDYCKTEPTYKFKILEYLDPAFDPDFKGILHFDEIAQASKEVQELLYMIYYDRRIDDRKLSDGAMIVLSMNPPQMSEYMISTLDKASVDRVMLLKVEGRADEWLNWAKKKGVNDSLISFVEEHPGCYDKNKGRRLEHFSAVIDSFGTIDPENVPIAFKIMAHGTIDIEHADLFTKYLKEVFEISGIMVLQGDKKTMSRLEKMISAKDKAVHLHRIHSEMTKGVSDPTKYLTKMWEEKGSNKDKWAKVAGNIMKYTRILQKRDMDSAVSLYRSLSKMDIHHLDEALNEEFKKKENSDFAKEVLRCMAFPEQESQPNPNGNVLTTQTD